MNMHVFMTVIVVDACTDILNIDITQNSQGFASGSGPMNLKKLEEKEKWLRKAISTCTYGHSWYHQYWYT